MTNAENKQGNKISNTELSEWAELRADDAGRLARELVQARRALMDIKDRLETAFGAGVWDLPMPNPNGPSRVDHQNAALYSMIEKCRIALPAEAN